MGLAQILSAIIPFAPRASTGSMTESLSLMSAAGWTDMAGQGLTGHLSEDQALSHSAWFRAIALKSDAAAKLPLRVYRLTFPNLEKSGFKPAPDHEWDRALRIKPSPYHTPSEWKRAAVACIMTTGNAYCYIDRSSRELRPLSPGCVTPFLEATESAPASRKLWYMVRGASGKGQVRHPDEILHFRGPSFDGLIGKSVFRLAAEATGIGLSAQKYTRVLVKNNARPSVILTYPGELDDETRREYRMEWERMYAGEENAGRTAVLDRDMKAVPLSMTASDIGLIDLRKFSVIDVANFTGVPAFKLGNKDGEGYNSLEQGSIAWLGDSMDPLLVSMEQELDDKLLTEQQKDQGSHACQFDRTKLSPSDRTARAAYYRAGLGGHPWLMINEVRHEEGLEPDPDGDVIPAPLNMGGINNDPANPADNNAKPSSKLPLRVEPSKMPESFLAAVDTLLEDATSRVLVRVAHQVAKAAADGDRFVVWVDGFAAKDGAAVAAIYRPAEIAAQVACGHKLEGKLSAAAIGQIQEEFRAVAESNTPQQLSAATERVLAQLGGKIHLAIRRLIDD